ncbi:MAG: aminotransferase class III-fold pyridoxal phosphate-dependent enzyme [Dehalococcoidia bacterium]|nr:aminotransferase class III-fold pyridoxal phosphate-dependent enzyme [Dehalococcoidia bacterium]
MSGILESFEATHDGSRRLAERARGLFPSGVTHDARAFEPFPIYVQRAAGARKWDVDGNEYVDYVGGHGALLLGHNHPEVVDAIQRALALGTHFGASHELEIEWAEQVVRMVPCGERVRFFSSGTEATMMALRLARAHTGRERVVKLAEHFHGWHDLVVGRLRPDDPHPHSPGVPEGFYDALTIVPAGDAQALREALAPRDVAAVILEPTGAHWGTHPLPLSYLRAARALTAEAGTLLILDEVITGFRMAPGGASERYGVTPDLSTHAKILAGGLPGGCVTGRDDVLSMLDVREGDVEWTQHRRVAHQGTFNANPVSAAAGVAALRVIARGGEIERAEAATARLVRGLNALFAGLGVPGSAWAVSSMWHLNLGYPAPRPRDVEWDAAEPPRGVPGALVRPLKWALFNHGVDLMTTGGMVSSAHGDAEIDDTLEAFRVAIGDLRGEGLIDRV